MAGNGGCCTLSTTPRITVSTDGCDCRLDSALASEYHTDPVRVLQRFRENVSAVRRGAIYLPTLHLDGAHVLTVHVRGLCNCQGCE